MGSVSEFIKNALALGVPLFNRSKASLIAPARVVTVPEPISKSDSRVLVDIGINSKISKNSWTALPTTPSAWTLTSATGTVADATGFTPAAAGNNITGRITSPVAFNSTLGAQGSIYCKVSRTGVSVNANDGGASSLNTTTTWWDSLGNTYSADKPGYPPTVWTVRSNAVTRYLSLAINAGVATIQDFNGGYFNISFSVATPSVSSPNIDPNFAEILFTWSGATYFLYVDGAMIRTGTLTLGAMPADLFYQVTIGNGPAGPNANLGGCFGPYKIERFHLSTKFTVPSPSKLLIGIGGDSYVVGGGGFNGDGGLPNVATISSILNANANGLIDTSIGFADNAASSAQQGITRWGRLLQGFAAKQLSVTVPFFAAAKSGYDSYFTGAHFASSARDLPTAATPLTAYADALNAARPAIVIELDSINSIIHTSLATLANCDPVADLKWRYDYLANGNPNLRAILCIEAHSPELVATAGLSGYGVANGANAATVSASFRASLRAAFYAQQYLAGGSVPVIYVPTYEQLAGSAAGATFTYGSEPRNTVTTGSAPHGPSGTAPDIHMTVRGYIKLADIIWAALKPVIQAVLPVVEADIPYDGGNQATTITPNLAFGAAQTFTLTGNVTVAAPINPPVVGARLRLRLVQDSTGSRTVTFNSAYRNAAGTTLTLAAGTANLVAYLEFECLDQATNKWQFVGGSTAFA